MRQAVFIYSRYIAVRRMPLFLHKKGPPQMRQSLIFGLCQNQTGMVLFAASSIVLSIFSCCA